MIQQTRSGRVVKRPDRYVPQEVVEDDFDPEDYDSDESEVKSDTEITDDEEEEEDDDDEGSLKDFIVGDDEDEEEEASEEEEENEVEE